MQARFAAAIYTPKQTDKSALPIFVAALKQSGVDVAGIIQESQVLPGDTMRTIDSVDILTGQRIPIKKPMSSEEDCGLDVSNLVETTAILRNVLTNSADLVVVEKFGDQEQEGAGLFDEIMQIIAADIPLLIAVPKPALKIWQEMTGELGAVIGYSPDAMQDWYASVNTKPL